MKQALIAAVAWILLTQLAFASSHDIPAGVDDPGPDLPAVGSSLFDKLYSKKNAAGEIVYDVPNTIPALISRMTDDGASMVDTFLPFSRSLQRPRDLSYDPLLNPRLVFTPSIDFFSPEKQDRFLAGNIFFGYSKPADQLEVISYNFEAGRYEFQIIKDFSSDPKVYYVNRSKCLTCHQGQAGIFSRSVWPDTTEGIGGDLIMEKLGFHDRVGVARVEALAKTTELLFGPLASTPVADSIDIATTASNSNVFQQKVWLYGCENDPSCRLGLVMITLAPGESAGKPYIDHMKQVFKHLPEPNWPFYESHFSGTDFGLSKVVDKYGSIANVVSNRDALLEMVSLIYNLSYFDNPASKREQVITVAETSEMTQLFAYVDLLNDLPTTDIANALLRVFKQQPSLFSEHAMNSVEIMYALLTELHSPYAKIFSPWLNHPAPKPALYSGRMPPVFQENALNIFSRHCASCHATDSNYPPGFLNGSEDDVKKNISLLKNKIISRLEHNSMPPRKEDREFLKSSGDYARLIEYLQN